ncbi:MAG: crossover junction endodeoxyribonuclease RuvC [Chlamydiota bacterium]
MTLLKKKSVILGLDPGTRVTGYGIIQTDGHHYQAIDYGCIRLPEKEPFSIRASLLFDGVDQLLTHYPIHAVSVEGQYMHKNAQSALKLGMAKGVAILAATKRNIPIHEYSPKKAKLAATGNGNASKEQVQRMIQMLFHLPTLPKPQDAADALALAFCHSHHQRRF